MSSTTPKQFYVIAFDIVNDKRRQKVSKLLEQFGVRCNYSVFKCMVTDSQFAKIQSRLIKIVDTSEVSLLFYYLCKSCVQKLETIGYHPKVVPEVIMV